MVTTLPAFSVVRWPVVSAMTEAMLACDLSSRCGDAEPSDASISEPNEAPDPKLRFKEASVVPPLLFTSSTPFA